MATAYVECVSDKNVCLILLIGLPGSGKTFLTNFLVENFRSATPIKDYFTDLCVIPITYDDYITYDDNFDCITDWKQKRRIIFNSVEEVILYFKGIKSTLNNNLYNINNKHFYNYSDCFNKKTLFIIIDDNMYYKSMRFEYYKLAKKHEISFCQIFLDTTLENALEFNKRRLHVVPSVIIERMHMKIEKPNPDLNQWEHNSISIPAYIDFNNDSILNKLHNVIECAVRSPEKYKSLETVPLDVNKCKAITDTNLLHQIDIRLRSSVNSRIKELRQNQQLNKNILKYEAEGLNNRRLQLMKMIKSNLLPLPNELINILQSPNSKTVENDKYVNNFFLDLFVCDKTD